MLNEQGTKPNMLDMEKEDARCNLLSKTIAGLVLTPLAIGIMGGLAKIFWRENQFEPLTWFLSGLAGTTTLTAIVSSNMFDRLNERARKSLGPRTMDYYQYLITQAEKPELPPEPPLSPPLPPTLGLGPIPSPIIPYFPLEELSVREEISVAK